MITGRVFSPSSIRRSPDVTEQLQPATVVIPTRDRPDRVANAVASVLRSSAAPAAVIVVDQGIDEDARRALEALGSPVVQYLQTTTRGISAALNAGIAAAQTEAIAITGDDCEVSATWLRELLLELEQDPAVGVVYGSVLPGSHDSAAGFIPCFVRYERVEAAGLHQQYRIGGTTACMALRRSLWERLGGFDEALGVGSHLGSAEDADFSIRSLIAGYRVVESPRPQVVHLGFYAWSERRRWIDRNWYGTGAAFAKALKLGHPQILASMLRLGIRWVRGRSPMALGLGQNSHRRATLAAFARGLAAGFRPSLEHDHFRMAEPAAPLDDRQTDSAR